MMKRTFARRAAGLGTRVRLTKEPPMVAVPDANLNRDELHAQLARPDAVITVSPEQSAPREAPDRPARRARHSKAKPKKRAKRAG